MRMDTKRYADGYKTTVAGRSLVIGDVHGHLDRLAALLEQEGIIREIGDGEFERIDFDTEVVQLGDLGHFGFDGSPTGDLLSWQYANEWIDVLLWGNHDRAVVEERVVHSGYRKPSPEVIHLMRIYEAEGKLKWAHEAHGHLMTHAGLHPLFGSVSAEYLNSDEADDIHVAIPRARGGRHEAGGILWRDISEDLHKRPQVFGHSASREHQVRYVGDSVCIDIGGKGDKPGDACLAGLYLPDRTVVRIDL